MERINYSLRKSRRAKHMRLTIYCDGNCVVTIPRGFDLEQVDEFVREKSDWIRKKIKYFEKRKSNPVLAKSNRGEYKKLKLQACEIARARVVYFNQVYNFRYNKISIRNQKTRWGSCSKKGNLNFNYKIALLPQNLFDYIIVHELCHLQEFNHSKKFWKLVEMTIPNYKDIRKKLR